MRQKQLKQPDREGVAFQRFRLLDSMCSDPGQNLIISAIKEKGLDGIVVGPVHPECTEPAFRKACAQAGLNPFMCEMANLREHCSWVHEKGEATTEKAIDLVRILVEKVKYNHSFSEIKVPVTKTALVIGGGIAGIQASLDIANTGHKVILIEKEPFNWRAHVAVIGNISDSRLLTVYPYTAEWWKLRSILILHCIHMPNSKVLRDSLEISRQKSGENQKASMRSFARVADLCTTKCPVKKIPSEFNEGLGKRTAIYVPFPQAVPNKPVIDRKNCTYYIKGKCKVCEIVCPTGAIRFDQEDQIMEVEVGAIVIATGFTVKQPDFFPEYGYGKYADVITGLQFERLASASGPTLGEIRRPSDGKVPEKIVFLACAGSRDPAKGIPYCSKICCMYIAKHAMLYQHKVHGGKSYVFYMDIRAGGKQYEEFVRRAIEDDGVNYVRGRVSRIYEKNGKLIVSGVDTLLNAMPVEIEADMVVLATAGVANDGAEELAQKLHVSYDPYKFFAEAHPKLKPVETNTAGIFLAGACQAPRDIPESVAMASGAAVKVAGLFSQDELTREPIIAVVNRQSPPVYSSCVGCFLCLTACPYQAIEKEEIKNRTGEVNQIYSKGQPRIMPGLWYMCCLLSEQNQLIYRDIHTNRCIPKLWLY